MPFRKEVDENFRFLVLEVKSLVEGARGVLRQPDVQSLERITSRDDYIDNLKGTIESKSFSQIFYVAELDKPTVALMKAVLVIASNLERIADYSVNIIRQIEHFHDPAFIKRYDVEPLFSVIIDSLDLIYPATFNGDVKLALNICRAEFTLDEMYEEKFFKIREQLSTGQDTDDLLTTLFIFRYLERVGDALLNIGEAVISAKIGEKLKIHQYWALQDAIHELSPDGTVADLAVESIWETRSGCRIARIQNKNGDALTTAAVFKEGSLKKLEEEKANIERWQKLRPGLVPKLFGFEKHGRNGSLLMEWLSGDTLKTLLLTDPEDRLHEAMQLLVDTLRDIWVETRVDKEVNVRHFDQLLARIGDVHRVHPDYQLPANQIGRLEAPSFNDLLSRARHIDDTLSAPFSVFTHGDLNIDNIIYNHRARRIHLIDVHRSGDSDYVQDVAVFLVSNFRVSEAEPEVRVRLNWAITEFYRFARAFAQENHDTTFDARLTLGLIRSFASSTRFELREEFAKSMFLRSVFLTEKILGHEGKPWETFKVPEKALVYE